MANRSSDQVDKTHTFDAGVNHSEPTGTSNLEPTLTEDVSTLTYSYSTPLLDDLQANWFGGDSVGTDGDLFGEFMYASPKVPSPALSRKSIRTPSSAKSFAKARFCDPRELSANQPESNIDPSLRASKTDSPRHSDHARAAGSLKGQPNNDDSWNIPPLGHCFWETFPFLDYMAAAGRRDQADQIDSEQIGIVPEADMYPDIGNTAESWAGPPTHFDAQPFGNGAPPTGNQGTFVLPQNMPTQYGEPSYLPAVPGYGTVDNSSQYFSNPTQNFGSFPDNLSQPQPFGFSMPQQVFSHNDQMPFGGATKVEAWIPSTDPWACGSNLAGLGITMPDDVSAEPQVALAKTRRPSGNSSAWDADKTDSEVNERPHINAKPTPLAMGKKQTTRNKKTLEAIAKAQDAYQIRKRPANLVLPIPGSKRPFEFSYNRLGELDNFYSAAQLREYMLHTFSRSQSKRAWMLIQCVPADSGPRYPTANLSDKCRFLKCPAANHTIAQGTFRVALDEEVGAGKYDPFHVAGFVHLYCLEHFLDMGEIATRCCITADTRRLKSSVEGPQDPGKLHLNRTSTNNVPTARQFLDDLMTGRKKASGFDGYPWEYNKTLCWKLTRNATADAKALRHEYAKRRGGINIFVHFNDEQRKLDLLEMKRTMDKHAFDREMDQIFDRTVLEAQIGMEYEREGQQPSMLSMPKKSSDLAKRRDQTRSGPKPRNASAAWRKSDDGNLRRSPRFSNSAKPASDELPSPIQTTQGRKRSRQYSETDAPGSAYTSPTTLRPTKRTKLNEQPSTKATFEKESQSQALQMPVPSVLAPSAERQNSPLSPPTVTSRRRSLHLTTTPDVPAVTAPTPGQSSPLSPPPVTPAVYSPVEATQGTKRSRQGSHNSLFGTNSDAESTRSLRSHKRTRYSR